MKGFRKLGDPLFAQGLTSRLRIGSRMTAGGVSAPDQPTGLTATPVSTSQINLAWTDASGNETAYRVYRSTDGVNYSQIGTDLAAGTQAYNDTTPTGGTDYWYKVAAVNAGGETLSDAATANTLTYNLVSYWKLDQAVGASKLDSIGTNHLADNDTLYRSGGKIQSAFYGINSGHLSVASNATLQTGDIDFMVWGWFNPGSTAAFPCIFAKDDLGGNREWDIYFGAGSKLIFQVYKGAGSPTATSNVVCSTSAWHFFIAWHDSATDKIWISVDDEAPVSGNTGGALNAASSAPVTVGAFGNAGGKFTGVIDELGFRKCAPSADERAALWNSGNGKTIPANSPANYFTLGAEAQVMTPTQAWETTPPHNMSVLEVNSGGFQYWCWYGLQNYPSGGPIGLARSNDLTTWTKLATPTNPIIPGSYRWPSVIKVGATFYMAATKWNGGTSLQSIVLLSSADGLSWSEVETIVAEEAGYYHDCSCLYFNANDSKFYLYHARINQATNHHEIMARSHATITDLDGESDAVVLNTNDVKYLNNLGTLAAPNIMYYGGKYYLTAETLPVAGWATNAFISSSPTSGFVEMTGPVLVDGDACCFQHQFGGALHLYYAKLDGTWTMYHRQGTLA